MHARILIPILAVLLAVSLLSLFLFALEGDLGGRDPGLGAGISRSFWLISFAPPLAALLGILGYSLALPELSEVKPKERASMLKIEKEESTLDAVLRILKDDERKVVQLLVA